MSLRLLIADDGYALAESRGGVSEEMAVLQRGAEALLSSGHLIDEARLEAAIERAEDWLMPHAPRLRGEVLEVEDLTGRLSAGLREFRSAKIGEWHVEEVERFFQVLVDMTTGRQPAPGMQGRSAFVADVLLLRELAHHGQLRAIRLC